MHDLGYIALRDENVPTLIMDTFGAVYAHLLAWIMR